jgi:hypothetical protein
MWDANVADYHICSINQRSDDQDLFSLSGQNGKVLHHVENEYAVMFPKVHPLTGLAVHLSEIVDVTCRMTV